MSSKWFAAGLLAVGLTASLPVASQAQEYRYSRRADTYNIGYKIGLQDGLNEGSNDGRRGHRFELQNESDYRNGIEGYRPHYGSKRQYAEGFRAGFEQGYRNGYARYQQRDRRYGYDKRDAYGKNDNYNRRDDDRRDDDDY